MTIQCKMCGAEFETKGHWAKYCPECRKQNKRDWQRKNYLTRTQGADIAERYLAAEKQRKEMNAVLEKANAAGLSYGQYVAQEEERKTMKETPKEELGQTAQHKPGIVRRLITQALQSLDKSEADCKEIGEARGLLTAAKMILEDGT